MKKLFVFICLMLCLCSTAFAGKAEDRVVLGIENLKNHDTVLKGVRLGLFTNQTGVDNQLNRSADILKQNYDLRAIYVPEHGLLGAVKAGEKLGDATYEGLPVYSLYGDSRRPSAEMLKNIDVMCVDIQDVGTRHYTYFSSLAYIMEECGKAHKSVVVFDRPNPLGGFIQGPVLKPEFKSFIGLYEIPLRHGLTIGEYALYINATQNLKCGVTVVPMRNYDRNMLWEDTGLEWVMTSPLIPTAETSILYCATGVAGDTGLSVGVGTAKPFYFVGAPFADSKAVKTALEAMNIKGVQFREAAFNPRYGAYEGQTVKGVELYITEPKKVNLPELGYRMVYTFSKLYPDKLKFQERGYNLPGAKVDIALGEDSLRRGEAPEAAFARWLAECKQFYHKAAPYYLYSFKAPTYNKKVVHRRKYYESFNPMAAATEMKTELILTTKPAVKSDATEEEKASKKKDKTSLEAILDKHMKADE